MRSVVLLLFGVHLAYAGTHSLKYFYTAVSGDIDFPELTVVGLVDEGQFMYFDSNLMKAVPKTEWMSREGADYWDSETQIDIGAHQTFKNNIQLAMERFNQSKGVHSLQLMYGCELDDDGTTRGYLQFGYDGEDFISLDKSTLTWTAANPQAFISKIKWDSTGAAAKYWKGYLENTCTESLQKYLSYGKDTLERKVSPQVSLLQKSSSSPVTCHATGFYPSGVTITWQRNGQDHHEDVDLGELLPNEDGTFQKSISIRVTPDEWKKNKFSCVVEHQGKTFRKIDKIRMNWGHSDPMFTVIINIGVAAVILLVVIIGVFGCKVYLRKKTLDSKPSIVDSAKMLIVTDSSIVENTKGPKSFATEDSTKSLTNLNSNPDPGYNSGSSDSDLHIGSDNASVFSESSSDSGSSVESNTPLLHNRGTRK